MAPKTPTIHSLLNLPKNATRYKVNKAYKKAAKAAHPDKGGSTKAMAALNAAKDAYDNGGVTESDTSDGDNSDDDGGIDMNDNESDKDDQEGESPLSDGESVARSTAETSDGESDEETCAFKYNYGDLEQMDVLMEEVNLVVTMKKHEKICGCDLNDPNTTHFLKGVDSYDDDTDSGVEDVDAVDENDEDADNIDKGPEGEAVNAEEADDIDEGYEEGDGEN